MRAERAEGGEASGDGTDRLDLTVADSDEFVRTLVTSGLPFERLAVRGASLEEAFLALTVSTPASPERIPV